MPAKHSRSRVNVDHHGDEAGEDRHQVHQSRNDSLQQSIVLELGFVVDRSHGHQLGEVVLGELERVGELEDEEGHRHQAHDHVEDDVDEGGSVEEEIFN